VLRVRPGLKETLALLALPALSGRLALWVPQALKGRLATSALPDQPAPRERRVSLATQALRALWAQPETSDLPACKETPELLVPLDPKVQPETLALPALKDKPEPLAT